MNIFNNFVIICMLILISCIPVQAAESNIVVTSYTVTPSIMMPDEKGIVTVTLSGMQPSLPEQSSLTEMTTSTPAFVSSPSVIESVFLNGKKDIDVLGGNGQFEGVIGAGQSIQIAFVIQAPPINGLYFAELLIRFRNQESIKYPIAINVNTPISAVRQPSLILSQSSSGPIKPGDSLPVKITLTNRGISQAKDITVRVKETGPSIAPLHTSAFHIDKLREGESSSGEIAFNTDTEASPGIHKIPVEIMYSTPDKGDAIISESVSLDIRGDADVSITSLETTPSRIQEKTPFDLIIRLDNAGTGDAESVRAYLDLPFQGSKEAFVGRIEPHNDAPAVFVLQSGDSGTYPYHLNIQYKDDWGEHQKTENLTLMVVQPSDGTIPILILIILACIGYAGYRFWTRRGDG